MKFELPKPAKELYYILALASLLVNIVLGIYLYVYPKNTPDLFYNISQWRTPIVSQAEPKLFTVLYKGEQVKSDVSSASVEIGNAGDAPVRGNDADVLSPLTVFLPAGTPILEAYIISVSRPEAGFSLDLSNKDKGSVQLNWKAFESNDKVEISFIYAGATSTEIDVRGAFVGQRKIRQFQSALQLQSRRFSLAVGGLVLLLSTVVIALWLSNRNSRSDQFISIQLDTGRQVRIGHQQILMAALGFISSGFMFALGTYWVTVRYYSSLSRLLN